jgi:pimeloyl-ACP methyl ester carboxylesterase
LPSSDAAPAPDPGLEPEGYLVTVEAGVRIHFHDWGGPGEDENVGGARPRAAGVVLVPGLFQPAITWAPVARRLARVRRTIVADLRGHGLSDAPMTGYDLETLAGDVIAVVEGSGVLVDVPVVLAGHGFGAIVVAAAAARLGTRCAGLVLVDGGWERLETTTGLEVDQFLRGLDEPPEVMRSMAAWLGDRRAFDPGSWDVDQERAARDAVVETAAGHVVRAIRPHVAEAVVRTMFAYDPARVLTSVGAPVTALVAGGAGDTKPRLAELDRAGEARTGVGLPRIRVVVFARDAHNLPRYRPGEVTATILSFDR